MSNRTNKIASQDARVQARVIDVNGELRDVTVDTDVPLDFLADMPIELLAEEYLNAARIIETLQQRAIGMQNELRRKMEEEGALEFIWPGGAIVLKPGSVDYNPERLDDLTDHLEVEELVAEGALIPEHEETVPRKWNATKTKKFAKRGKRIGGIIESAKSEGPKRVTVERRLLD